MLNNEKTVWGIHAGKTGDADSLFLKKNLVALGWLKMGDIGKLEANREAFKAKVAEIYPDKKPGAIPNSAGQMFRFVHEIQLGDFIIYPSKMEKKVHIGEIIGEFYHDTAGLDNYPQRRKVKWLKAMPRTSFTQGALYEIGAALSFFQVKSYADEFIAYLEGKNTPDVAPIDDDTVSIVAEEIQQTTDDFILKRLSSELKGHPLEEFAAHLLETMGYKTRVTQKSNDGGVDIIAHRDELGFEPPIIKVQVKAVDGSTGDPVVSALYGKVSSGEFGLLITLGTFTKQALNFASGKSNLRLIDGSELVKLILQHYEEFNSKYKGLIPLKRVYVPEVLEETENN